MTVTYGPGAFGVGPYGMDDTPIPSAGPEGPPADMRLRAYQPNGPSLGLLPAPGDVQAQFALNDVGALTVKYDLKAPRAALLGQPLELAVEVTWDGGQTWWEPASGRFLYLRDAADNTKPDEGYSIEAPGYLKRLEKALIGFTGLDQDGRRTFPDLQTPGYVLAVLWDEAQARGALEGMTRTWTATADSNGTPWPEGYAIGYDPGANLLAVLQGMAESGWIDFRGQGRSVQAYVAESPSGLAQDQTVGNTPVVLRYGRDLTEAPFRRTWEGLADTALVLGDEGKTVTRINPAAIKPWGVQETFVTASGVTDDGTLSTLGDAALTYTETERVEHTFGLEFGITPHLPFRDYRPGDWVLAASKSSVPPQRVRVRAVTLTRDGGRMGGNVVLNDRFLEADILQARRIAKLTAGATQSGSGTPPSPVGVDILAPDKVDGLTADSDAYVTPDGFVRSQITLNWNPVTQNADNTPTNDVAEYHVWGRVPTQTDWWQMATTTVSEWYASDFQAGDTWEFKVRALDGSGNVGAFSEPADTTTAFDLTPPPKPAAPTAKSRIGTAYVTWGGKTATNTDMAGTVPDFRFVSIHVSPVNGFTPTDANRVGELDRPGYVVAGPLTYGVTYYARVVAWDSSGNASDPSAQVEVEVAPLVDVSNFPDDAMEELFARTGHFLTLTSDNFQANLIEGAWIKGGAITADKLTIGAQTGDNLIPNGDFSDLNEAGTQPLMWTVATRNGGGGTLGVDTVGAIGGTASAKVTLAAAADGAYLRSTAVPVIPGTVMFLEVKFRVNAAISGVPTVSFGTSPVGGDPRNTFLSGTTWQSHYNLSPPPANTVVTLRKQFTVPADHYLMAMVLSFPPNTGGGYEATVDGATITYAVQDSMVTDIGAGKIRTGVLQATERIVAGTLTGARAEMNGVGFQSFAADGRKMFEVLASSGETVIGPSTGVHIRMGAFANPYTGSNVGLIRFSWAGSGWGDGYLQSTYNIDGDSVWGTLRLTSPNVNWANAAYVDVRQRNTDGYSSFLLRAQEANFSANTFIFGSGDATTIDFRAFNSPGFTWSDYAMNQRVNVYFQAGFNLIRSIDSSGAAIQTRVQGSSVCLSFSGHELYANVVTDPAIGHYERNVALCYGLDRIKAQTYLQAGSWIPLAASAFVVNSDPRMKSNAKEAKGALAALRSLGVYDYDMEGILPRRTPKAPKAAKVRPVADDPDAPDVTQRVAQSNRARGVMADEVARVLPDAVNEDETGALSVSLYDLLASTIAALKELADDVDSLKPTPPGRNPK